MLGGYLEGPGGIRVHIKKQEYPYDIGIWANIKQSMGGSANVSMPVHGPNIDTQTRKLMSF